MSHSVQRGRNSPTRKTYSDSQILVSYILDIPRRVFSSGSCSLLLVLTTFAEDRWLLNVGFFSLFKSIELQTRLTVQVLWRRIALLLVQQHHFPDFHRFDALLSLLALNMQRLHVLYNYKTKNNIPRRYVPSLSLVNAVYTGIGVCVKKIVKKQQQHKQTKKTRIPPSTGGKMGQY